MSALLQPIAGLTLDAAYAMAAERHRLRLGAGERPVGRKIGHTNTATWATQGISAPSWGWLYAASTLPLGETLDIGRWREPKVELECVLRLGADGRPDAMALGLEIVDRPYPSWQITVADSVAVNGVHAALLVGPWLALDEARLSQLQAELQVGELRSEGGSALVFGSPLASLVRLAELLAAQAAAPLQPGEIITTGALAPALPLQPGELRARIEGLGACAIALSKT